MSEQTQRLSKHPHPVKLENQYYRSSIAESNNEAGAGLNKSVYKQNSDWPSNGMNERVSK